VGINGGVVAETNRRSKLRAGRLGLARSKIHAPKINMDRRDGGIQFHGVEYRLTGLLVRPFAILDNSQQEISVRSLRIKI
jgi:hypothetical protein